MSKPVSVCNKHIQVRICSQMINDNTAVSPLQSPNRHRPAQQLLCACQIICTAGSFTLGTERPGCICLLWHRSSQRLLEHTWLWPAPVLHTECNHCLQPLSTCKPVTDSMTFAARQSGAETLKRVFFAQLCFRIVRAHQAGKSGKTVHFFVWFSAFWEFATRPSGRYGWKWWSKHTAICCFQILVSKHHVR